MNELQMFKNDLFEVAVKLENGNIVFDAELVAKCLGFKKIENKNGKHYTSIRWERVNEYLGSFRPQMGEIRKGDFIPESAVYKLAFKASNEVAEKFQDWLAIEVLPSIRKHGAYMTENVLDEVINNPDFGIKLLTELKKEKEEKKALQNKVEADKPKVLFADAVATSSNTILIGELAKLLKQNSVNIGQNRLFEYLRKEGYLGKSGDRYNQPTQYSMDLKLFEIKKNVINNPDGSIRVTSTTKVTGKGQIYFINKFKTNFSLIKEKGVKQFALT